MYGISQIVRSANAHYAEQVRTSGFNRAVANNADIVLNQTRSVQVSGRKLRAKRIYVDSNDRKCMVAISAFKHLRTHVLIALADLSTQSLMVTGTTKGVGKSVTAINLAISIARHTNRTAMLVDLDLRAPSLHRYFGFESEGSIVDVARGVCAVKDILVSPGIPRLSILPGKGPHIDSSELLSWSPLQSVIREIKYRYPERVVIFDLPPVLGCDDVAAVSSVMDACLVVIEEGRTNRFELREGLKRIGKVPVLGMILNKSKSTEFSRYYY